MARGVVSALLAAAAWAPSAAGLAAVAKKKERQHTVMALAAYPYEDISQFHLPFINTLRGAGFEGNIFLGMWEGVTDNTGYMQQNRVTPKFLRKADCKLRYEDVSNNYVTRNQCTEDYPHMKLDNARWIYARKWLQECSTCDGWAMFADFSDINFQRDPFKLLPDVDSVPPETVYMTEEMLPRTDSQNRQRGVSTNHWLVQGAVQNCYGVEAGDAVADKPMINIASSFGTRAGTLRWLGDLEQEFEKNSYKRDCDPVHICDQGVLNYLVYAKGAMPYASSKKYGEWIVNTMGVPCSNQPGLEPSHSLEDIVIIDGEGRVWNEDGSLPAVIHQGKVCHLNYIVPYLGQFEFPGDAISRYGEVFRGMANATFPGRKSSKRMLGAP